MVRGVEVEDVAEDATVGEEDGDEEPVPVQGAEERNVRIILQESAVSDVHNLAIHEELDNNNQARESGLTKVDQVTEGKEHKQ